MDITETKYVGTATIVDLPPEVIEIILKHVKLYKDRKSSRSVCRLWRDWIDRDSSAEKYSIFKKTFNDDANNLLEFKYLVPEFLSYQRQKISLQFNSVDLKETNDYWIEKGDQVIRLDFKYCRTIPIEEILKYCSQIQEITICFKDLVKERNLIESTKQVVEKGITNLSVKLLSIDCGVNMQEVLNFAQLFNGLFPCLKELKLNTTQWFDLLNLDEISQSFAKYNFEILLTYLGEPSAKSQVVFNSPPGAPTRLIEVLDYCYKVEEYLNCIVKYNYRNLRILILDIEKQISFMKFQGLISNSSLEVLQINASRILHVGDHFFKNQLKKLTLEHRTPQPKKTVIHIGKNFIDSYQNLTFLSITSISFISFVKIINELAALETFKVQKALPDVLRKCPKHTLTNECLKVLSMPRSFFLQTATKCVYNFPNLHTFKLTNFMESSIQIEQICHQLNRNINYKDLECVLCPKLEYIFISLVVSLNQNIDEGYIQWINNILCHFPNIKNFCLGYPKDDEPLPNMSEELRDLLKHNKNLKKISIFKNIQELRDGHLIIFRKEILVVKPMKE